MLEVSGRCCLSLLSGSLQLFLSTWERNLGISCHEPFKSAFEKQGFVAGYSECFKALPRVEWATCPADLTIVEQIVLARNREQHHENLFSLDVAHTKHDLRKYRSPFFLSDDEQKHFSDESEFPFLMGPRIHVNAELLDRAITEVEIFCEWLEHQLFRAKYPNYDMPVSRHITK